MPAIFEEFNFGEEYFGAGEEEAFEIPDNGRIAWEFYDGTETYLFDVNPNTASMPTSTRTVTMQATCAGGQVRYEGKPETKKIRFSGVILDKDQYYTFKRWFDKRQQVRITDDLGQKFWIYIENFSPTRRKDITYPWYMDYTIQGTVLDRG